MKVDRRRFSADAAFYTAAALLPPGIVAWLLRLWEADLSAPFVYGGDQLFYQAQIKGWIEHASFLTNPSLGAPGVSQLYDFPVADGLNVLFIRGLGLLGAGSGTVMNLFYLSGYTAVGVVTAFVMRRLGVSRPSSLAVAVLFALLPYHYLRGESHLYLSMYWIVPALVLVLVWLDSPEPPLVRKAAGGRFPLQVRTPRTIAALAICAVAGACGVYYAFFGCFFLLLVGLRAAFRDRDRRPALAAVILVLVSACVFGLQMIPNAVFWARHGTNPETATRTSYEAEVYGLRITQMLLPIGDHRVPAMATKRLAYRAASPGAATEADTAALGILGSLGFVASISALLLGWPRSRQRRPGPAGPVETARTETVSLRWLGMLTASAALLGTVAGFGAVFAAAVTPQIRAYNRISVFIAFFAFVTIGLLADRFLRFRAGTPWRVAATAVVGAVALLGVLDQTPRSLAEGRKVAQSAYGADTAFGRQVQARLPAGATVFQLPYVPYPEWGPTFGMLDCYEPLRGYLHTTGLRWSSGAMKGRPDAAWQQATASLPVAAMVDRLRAAGFDAVWVQMNGYEDGGTALAGALTELLGPPAVVKENGVVAVWRLRPDGAARVRPDDATARPGAVSALAPSSAKE
jgi:phosphoglycerol transferase